MPFLLCLFLRRTCRGRGSQLSHASLTPTTTTMEVCVCVCVCVSERECVYLCECECVIECIFYSDIRSEARKIVHCAAAALLHNAHTVATKLAMGGSVFKVSSAHTCTLTNSHTQTHTHTNTLTHIIIYPLFPEKVAMAGGNLLHDNSVLLRCLTEQMKRWERSFVFEYSFEMEILSLSLSFSFSSW